MDFNSKEYKILNDKWTTYKMDLNSWAGAVVILEVEDKIFTILRAETMPTHKGQIGLIGGHRNDNDQTPIDVIKREFSEETSLDPNVLDIQMHLPAVYTSHQKLIIPVHSKVQMPLNEFTKNIKSNSEWDTGILIPIDDLLNFNSWAKAKYFGREANGSILFKALDFSCLEIIGDQLSGIHTTTLWGATARMLWYFAQLKKTP